jgi:hypothetical protein
MPEKYSARVLQPDRLHRNMPLHRLQITHASFQWTVDIESRRPGGSVHGHHACAPDGRGIQTSAVQGRTVLGGRKLMSDLVPHGIDACVKVALCGGDRRAMRRDVGEHTGPLTNRYARIYRYLVAQDLDRDRHGRARHPQEPERQCQRPSSK